MKKVTLADGNEVGKFNLSFYITDPETFIHVVADMIANKMIDPKEDRRVGQDEIEDYLRSRVQTEGTNYLTSLLGYLERPELLEPAKPIARIAFGKFFQDEPEVVPIQEVVEKVNQDFKDGKIGAMEGMETVIADLDQRIEKGDKIGTTHKPKHEMLSEKNQGKDTPAEIYTPEQIKKNKKFEATFLNGGKKVTKTTPKKSKATSKAKKTVKA
jgi:hypothetical protein